VKGEQVSTTSSRLGRTAGYVQTRYGQIHYVEQGAGMPVLLLHQTPRSVDEYRDVLPLLADSFRAIAMDTLGFGASARPTEAWSIDLFAGGVLALVDALGLDRFGLVGHHTGGVIAVEVAACASDRVGALVLSGTPYVDAARRVDVAANRPAIDEVTVRSDGAHLTELWQKRMPFYPADRPDLLARLVADGLRVLDRVEEGHRAVNAYRMEERIGAVTAPTHVVCGELDTFSRPDMGFLVQAIAGATSELVPDTGVPAVDHRPAEFVAAIKPFLTEHLLVRPADLVGGER
jgi:pimeloyl-ACP methyl ester carboxylesterase